METKTKQSPRLLFCSGGALERVKSQWVRSSEALFSLGMATAATVCSELYSNFFSPVVVNCYYVVIYSVFCKTFGVYVLFSFVFLSLYFVTCKQIKNDVGASWADW